MNFKQYPNYKDSGVEWLGSIPSHWEVWKLSHAYKEIGSGTTPSTSNEENFEGDIPWVTTGELRENVILDTKKKVSQRTIELFPILRKYPKGSVAIAMYGATIGRLGILGVEATTNQACCVMTTSKVLNNKYLFYWLQAFKDEIVKLASGGAQPNINQEKVASLKISAPFIDDQVSIVNFLDSETSRIDNLIAKQEKLINLLEEHRKSVISHAVTKGLDPNVPMKDSGVEWLGSIPIHWEVWKLSHAYKEIGSGTTPSTSNEENFEGDIPWVTTGELRENVILDTKKKVSQRTIELFPILRKYPKGSVAIAMYGATIGRLGILGVEATTNQACCVMTTSKVLNNKYLFYWLQAFKDEIVKLASGGAQPNINQEKVASLKISAPFIDDQVSIVNFLDSETSRIDNLIAKQEKLIEKLKEYRSTIISHAVTGKIDVRDLVA